MRVSFYKNKQENREFDDKGLCGEFGSDSMHAIGRILNCPIEDIFNRDEAMKSVIVTYRTLYSQRNLRFVIQCSRALTPEEIRVLENGIGRSVSLSIYHVNIS